MSVGKVFLRHVVFRSPSLTVLSHLIELHSRQRYGHAQNYDHAQRAAQYYGQRGPVGAGPNILVRSLYFDASLHAIGRLFLVSRGTFAHLWRASGRQIAAGCHGNYAHRVPGRRSQMLDVVLVLWRLENTAGQLRRMFG